MKRALTVLGICGALMTGVVVVSSQSSNAQWLGQRWDYLLLQYSQRQAYTDNPSGLSRVETVLVDRSPYGDAFAIASGISCLDQQASEIEDCMAKSFKGSQYYLDVLGNDGWELVGWTNNSDQFTYEVEMIFKRPAM